MDVSRDVVPLLLTLNEEYAEARAAGSFYNVPYVDLTPEDEARKRGGRAERRKNPKSPSGVVQLERGVLFVTELNNSGRI